VKIPLFHMLVLLGICLSLANCSKKREQMPTLGNHLHGVWVRGDSQIWAAGDDGEILYSDNGGTTWQFQVSGTIHCLELIYGSGGELWTVGVKGTILHSTMTAKLGSRNQAERSAPCIRFAGATRF